MTTHPTAPGFRSRSAYSMVELLAVLSIIMALGAILIVTVSIGARAAQKSKLESDVATLNSAIRVYLSNGGELKGLASPSDVVNKLKTTRSSSDQKLHTGGPSGRMIDPRVVVEAVESTSWRARAVYNPAIQRFEVAGKGTTGVEFGLDEDLNEMSIPVESRDHGAVSYAREDTWVWDHGRLRNPRKPRGPSDIDTINPVNNYPGDPGTGGTGGSSGGGGSGSEDEEEEEYDPPPPPPPTPPRLPTPNYNIAGGAHPDVDFPLTLFLTNIPDSAIADPIIRIGSGSWETYTGAVSVPMNTRVKARYISKDPEAWRDSYTRSRYFYPIVTSLSGSVEGTWHSPQGEENLLSEITQNGTYFTNGDPTIDLGGEIIDAGEPNTLKFQKAGIPDVAPGESFKLGDLFYHNGTTFSDSHATGVKLKIDLGLDSPSQSVSFDLDFELVNTDNTDDADASADYVKLTNLTQNIPLTINGVGYQIKLEFGGTDSFGFSSENQFHVYEGATGQGEIRATFIAKP